jgi:hypothetical protein
MHLDNVPLNHHSPLVHSVVYLDHRVHCAPSSADRTSNRYRIFVFRQTREREREEVRTRPSSTFGQAKKRNETVRSPRTDRSNFKASSLLSLDCYRSLCPRSRADLSLPICPQNNSLRTLLMFNVARSAASVDLFAERRSVAQSVRLALALITELFSNSTTYPYRQSIVD